MFIQPFGDDDGVEFFRLQIAENQQQGSGVFWWWRLCSSFKSMGNFRRPVWDYIRQSITKDRIVYWFSTAVIDGFCVSVKYDNPQLVVFGKVLFKRHYTLGGEVEAILVTATGASH